MPIEYDGTGLTTQNLAEIVEERETELKTFLGDNFQITGDTVVGNIQASDSDREYDIQELLSFLTGQMSIQNATGIFLDWFGAYKNLERIQPVKQIITRTVKGVAGTEISSGDLTIRDNDLNVEFILNEDITLDGSGEYSAQFQSTIYGSLNVLTSDTFTIVTPIIDVSAVEYESGDTTVTTGRNAETDEEFRARIISSNLTAATGLSQAITDKLLELDSITASRYIENKSSTSYVYEEYTTGTGTITIGANNFAVTGSGTTFLTDLDTNYSLRYTDDNTDEQVKTVATITTDLACTISTKNINAATGVTYEYAPPTLPPNSFEIIVLGGTDEEIGQIILDNQVPTTETYGNTSVTVTDSEGVEEVIKFTRPVEQDIVLQANVYYTTALSVDEQSALVNEFVDYWNEEKEADTNKGIGLDVDSGDFGFLSNTNSKVRKIRNIEVKIDGDPSFTDYISIGTRELANLESSNITLTYIAV